MKLELPGKGPVAQVHLTFTFRPTEGLHDSASNIERDAFGFEIAPLQRDTYRAHKDVLQKIGKDDRERIDALLETGLHMNHQQVCSLRLFCRYFPIRNLFVSSEHYVLCLRCVHHSHAICYRNGSVPSSRVFRSLIVEKYGWYQVSSSAVCSASAPLTSQRFIFDSPRALL